MAAALTSVSWSTTGTTSVGGTIYANSTDTILITYHFSSIAAMHAGDKIFLSNGGAAEYLSGSNTTAVVFKYTVPAGAGVNTATLGLLDTSIFDARATSPASTVYKWPSTTYDVSAASSASPSQTIAIDNSGPTVLSATATDGIIHVGETATFTLTMSEPLGLGSTPTATLSNGATAIYNAGASTSTTLVFTYTVQSGDNAAQDLSITAVPGLFDAAGNTGNYSGNPTGTTEVIICFYPGTQIATPAGEVAVETLRIGDLVLTHDGQARPVRWMGRQTVSTLFADPVRVLPIRIAAGALGEGLPVRDLLVSPDHALLIEGVLVQAAALVNGSTIRRERGVPQRFTYHHVELADHSLILAEGVPAETFVDNVDRLGFDNWAEHEALHGELPAIPELDLPRARSARQLPIAVRNRIAGRADLLLGTAAAA